MSDRTLVRERLEQIQEGLRRILRRFQGVVHADDFLDSDDGLDRLVGIGMMLIAIGENLKKIDQETEGELLARYPTVNWRGAKGTRDILSHHYFDLDAEDVFDICQNDIPTLAETIVKMLKEWDEGAAA